MRIITEEVKGYNLKSNKLYRSTDPNHVGSFFTRSQGTKHQIIHFQHNFIIVASDAWLEETFVECSATITIQGE